MIKKLKACVQRLADSNSPLRFVNHLYEFELEDVRVGEKLGPWHIVRRLRGPLENLPDHYEGPFVSPGLMDSHLHLSALGESLFKLNLKEVRGLENLSKLLLENRTSDLSILEGYGWLESNFSVELEQLSECCEKSLPQDFLWILTRTCGHSALLSRSLRKQLGLENFPGFVTDQQLSEVLRRLPPPPKEKIEKYFLAGQELLLSQGISSVGDMSLDQLHVDMLEELCKKGKLLIDVQGVVEANRASRLEEQGPLRFVSSENSAYLGVPAQVTLAHWKCYLDGSFGSRTAWLTQAYADKNSYGENLISDHDLISQSERALSKGFLLSFHTIGDAALDQALRVAEKFRDDISKNCNKLRNWNNPSPFAMPCRLEHVQLARDEQITTLAKLKDWIVHLQPHHQVSDQSFIFSRLGLERYEQQAYRLQSFLKSGIRLALGSDAPIDVEDPLATLRAATEFAQPTERISTSQAVWYLSTGARSCSGMPAGQIREGQWVCLFDPSRQKD